MTISELLHLLKDIDEACSACNRCGMCQSVCPVFFQSRHEGDVARGKLALLDGLRRDMLKRPDRILERLNRCLLCGSCERCCSRKVPLTEIFIKSRIMITAYTGLSPLKKLVFRTVMARPALFEKLVRYLSLVQGLFLKQSTTGGTVKITRGLGGRHTLPLPDQSFRSSRKNITIPCEKDDKKLRVVFFTGCLIDKFMPQVGHACMQVLSASGAMVHVIEDEVCCGIPALASGDGPGFQKLLIHNLDRLAVLDYDYLVTACATCTSTIKNLWAMIDEKKDPIRSEQIRTAAERTLDITEFVLTHGQTIPMDTRPHRVNKPRIPITWHDPCHLKGKGQALKLARSLLATLPGYDFLEMKGADLCCGSGGSFNLDHYDLSRQIGSQKIRNILASGAAQVVTGCPGCMIQLTDLLSREGSDVRVRHIMELFAEAIIPPSDGK